jgi:hypothetical protein
MSDEPSGWEQTDHGVLSTINPTRGIDSVPVCFVVTGGLVGIPIDTVKPKRSTRLTRLRNLEADPRATLLVEHWDPDDWSALWWVRVSLEHITSADATRLALRALLSAKHAQYANGGIEDVIVLKITAVHTWQATSS